MLKFCKNRYGFSIHSHDGTYIGPIKRQKLDHFIKVGLAEMIDETNARYLRDVGNPISSYIVKHDPYDKRKNMCQICEKIFTPMQKTFVFNIIPRSLKKLLPAKERERIAYSNVIVCNSHRHITSSYPQILLDEMCQHYEIDDEIIMHYKMINIIK